jgi:hypothetical protein
LSVPQERIDFLREQLEHHIAVHANSICVALMKEQYNEVIKLNINYANQKDLTSFFKHCMKYIFILYRRNYEVVDFIKFKTDFGIDECYKTSTTISLKNERTMTPDGNVLVVFGTLAILGVVLIACLRSPLVIPK